MAALQEMHRVRARLAIESRWHGDDSEHITYLKRELKAASVAAYIERKLTEAPPLTDEQRARLADLLAPAADRRAA